MEIEKKKIMIVGCGPGAVELITPAAREAALAAEVLVVSSRLEALFPESCAERIDSGVDIEGTIEKIAARRDAGRRVAVLATGDPGVFSLAQPVVRHFGRENCEVIPGISSIQVAFARLGLPWHDAVIISAHKENPEITAAELRLAGKLVLLGGRTEGLRWIAGILKDIGRGRRIFLCEELTLPGERIAEITPGELMDLHVSTRAIVLAIRRELIEN
jgi:precorrin-6y C5,15-methyltransferase (decarboxylating) CbiE subunit